MTKTNKQHAKISRAALMRGIADMKAMQPKEKEELTQKEAIEIAAEVVQDLLGKGYGMAEIIEMMKSSFGLTLNAATVRSYLRHAKVANDTAEAKKSLVRRGRKAKSATAAADAEQIDVSSPANRKDGTEATGVGEENDSQQGHHKDNEACQHDTRDTKVDAQNVVVPDDSGDATDLIERLLAQFPADADLDMEGRG